MLIACLAAMPLHLLTDAGRVYAVWIAWGRNGDNHDQYLAFYLTHDSLQSSHFTPSNFAAIICSQ